jgi:hypothetical protein
MLPSKLGLGGVPDIGRRKGGSGAGGNKSPIKVQIVCY